MVAMVHSPCSSSALLSSSHLAPCSLVHFAASSAPSLYVRPARRGDGFLVLAVQRTPKGFGKVPDKKKEQQLQRRPKQDGASQLVGRPQQEEDDEEADEDEVVPEVVTNRMLKRITFTVGIPFAVGVAFFPLFYYLKVVKKVDVPEWLPLLTSLLTFGSAGAGITYGVLSASWDPAREGSALGWKEAQLNWPAFWQTLRGKSDDKSKQ